MGKQFIIKINEVVGYEMTKVIVNFHKGRLVAEEMREKLRELVRCLPAWYIDHEDGGMVKHGDQEAFLQMCDETIAEMGSENDHCIYGPSSGCVLYRFLDEEVAGVMMYELNKCKR